MKTLFTFMLSLFFTVCIAQDKTYVHEATAANTSSNGTVIDHPDLNNNPNAKIVFSHRIKSTGGIRNPNINGIWYRSSDGRWVIYNEEFTVDMEVGTQFTIFIADEAEVFTHVASVANQGTTTQLTVLDHPLLNGSFPGPYAVFSNYFNPNQVYNNNNLGFVFDGLVTNKRLLFTEGPVPIPENAAFKVMVIPPAGISGVITHDHLTSPSNTTGAFTTLNHPNLNNNPDAAFVFSHYRGGNGAGSEGEIDKVVGAFYDTTEGRWIIYTEDLSDMPLEVSFDIVAATQEILGNNDHTLASPLVVYPNPATTHISINASTPITEAHIYNMLGQEIKSIQGIDNNTQIDVSDLASGNYLVKVQAGEFTDTLKFIKQ